MRSYPAISKFIRFGVVGFSGFLVDFSVTWFFRDVAGIFEYIANAIGFTFGATSNYILNRRWTWRSDNPDISGEFAKFFVISLLGLGINSFVIWACRSMGVSDALFFGYSIPGFWIAKVIATAVVMVWNFIMNNYITFRQKNKSVPGREI